MKRFVLYLLLILLTAGVSAQQAEGPRIKSQKREPGKGAADSSKVARSNKGNATAKTTRMWTLSSDFTTEIPVPLDTAFSLFHRSRKTDKQSDFNIYPGNYGQPLYELNFFDRDWQPDRFLYSHYKPYMFTPSNTQFINTQVPFTEFVFTYGGAKADAEQTFHIRHSQNVNKDFNFGLDYDIIYNLGQYKYQRAKDKSFLFHSSYNGSRYTGYFSAGINNMSVYENGGIISAGDLEKYGTQDVQVSLGNLSEAQSVLHNRHIMLVQRYSPVLRRDTASTGSPVSNPVTISLISVYEWNKRRFFDSYPGNEFYDTILIDDRSTSDSLFQGVLANTLRIDVSAGGSGKFRIGAGAGIRSEIRRFGQVLPAEMQTDPRYLFRHFGELLPGESHLPPEEYLTKKSSLVLTGKVFNSIGNKFGWVATGDLWIQGYRAGDFIADGRIFKDFTTKRGTITWDATGTMASYTPSFWYSSWSANNYSRSYNSSREIRMMAGTSVSYPALKMSLRFNYALIDNYICFNAKDLSEQHTGALSVASLGLKKEFVVWKLHLDNIVLLQQSSNSEILSLPLAAAKSAFFFEHTFRFRSTNGGFDFQLGAEAFYHTPYYASAYMPVTGDFYNQSTTQTGDYPFVNAFLNIKLKRTRFYIMFDHLNSGYSGYDYFLVPDYPMNVRMLRYGLAWTFYN